MKLSISNSAFQIPAGDLKTAACRAFSLVEVLVAMTLLSIIVFALMAVFNSTQTAFRASLTQTDVLESSRATVGLMVDDLREMAPSLGATNGAKNFYVQNNFYQYAGQTVPLIQPLIGSGQNRTNVIQEFFVLSRKNQTWTGVGYVVDTAAQDAINPLYRFTMSMNAAAIHSPAQLFTNFISTPLTNTLYWSRLLEGVMTMRVRAYDLDGVWMTNGYSNLTNNTVKNVWFSQSNLGEVGFIMYSNALPSAVELELGILEDRTLQRAESRPNNLPNLSPNDSRYKFLQDQAGKVHLFRQRILIRNADPAAYQ